MRLGRIFPILTVAFGFTLSLLAGELTVRAFGLSKTLEMRVAATRVPPKAGGPIGAHYQPSRHWVGPYGARYRTNGLGFRDRDHERVKPPGVHRIAVLGDSVAEGLGVEEDQRFSARLEALLNAPGARPHEVMNFAIAGSATVDELEILKRDVLAFCPDEVLVQVCANDVAENRAREAGAGVGASRSQERLDWRALLRDHSGLYLFLAERYNGLRLKAGRSTRVLDELLVLHPGDLAPTARYLHEIARVADSVGASTRVFYPPSEAEARVGVDGQARHFGRLLESALGPSGPRLVTALAEVRGAAGCEAFLDDVHLSGCGHAVVAAVLARQLGTPEAR